MTDEEMPEDQKEEVKKYVGIILDCLGKDDISEEVIVSSLTNVLLWFINHTTEPEELSMSLAKAILNYKKYSFK